MKNSALSQLQKAEEMKTTSNLGHLGKHRAGAHKCMHLCLVGCEPRSVAGKNHINKDRHLVWTFTVQCDLQHPLSFVLPPVPFFVLKSAPSFILLSPLIFFFLRHIMCYVAQANQEVEIYIHQPPEYWNHSHASPLPAQQSIIKSPTFTTLNMGIRIQFSPSKILGN